MSKVVIAYSEDHFKPKSDLKPVGGSGLLAKTLFEAAQKHFVDNEVVYVDYRSQSSIRQFRNADLLISISENIQLTQKLIKPHKTILWAVNMPWIYRRRINRVASKIGFPFEGLQSQDGLRANSYELSRVDEVITLGNIQNFAAYADLMGSYEKVFPINFNMERIARKNQSIHSEVLIYLGDLSFRKGIDVAIAIAESLANNEIYVIFIGTTSNTYVNLLMEKLLERGNGFIRWHNQWIELNSDEWHKITKETAIALFPSREEGQAAVVCELISSGIPTIYSQFSGLDWPGNTEQPVDLYSSSWVRVCKDFLHLDAVAKGSFLLRQQQLVASLGSQATQLDSLMERISRGHLWPEILENDNCESNGNTPDKYIISAGTEQDAEIEIDVQISSTDENNRKFILVAACDKYQKGNLFNVCLNETNFAVKRITHEVDNYIELSNEKIRITTPTQTLIPRVSGSSWYWLKVAPWVYDRRLLNLTTKKILKFLFRLS